MNGWNDFFDPFAGLGDLAAKATDMLTAGLLTMWNAGLWVLSWALGLMDSFLTPDLSTGGPARELYQTTFWLAGSLLLVMMLVQLGVTALRRDGRSLGRLLLGTFQFGLVTTAGVGYAVTVLAACSGLTRALMAGLLNVSSWSEVRPWGPLSAGDVGSVALAFVLAFLGLVVLLAAIGQLLVMLTRAVALIVLVATAPIAAAGLVSQLGHRWFWKSVRWFHAAAFTPVLMVVVLGIGVRLTTAVAAGQPRTPETAVGSAITGVVLLCVATFSPLSLFKLLAFVDPGSPSGAAARAGLAGVGGLRGLVVGTRAGSAGGAGGMLAARSGPHGQSGGETDAGHTTQRRAVGSLKTAASALPVIGSGIAASLDVASRVGTTGTAIGADLTNQAGIGHNQYHPEHPRPPQPARRPARRPDRRRGAPQQPPPPTPGTPTGGPARDGTGAAATPASNPAMRAAARQAVTKTPTKS